MKRSFFYSCHYGALLLVATLIGCVAPPEIHEKKEAPEVRYEPAAWTALPGWSQDALSEAWPAWQMSCRALLKKEGARDIWMVPCKKAAAVDPRQPGAVRQFFEAHFNAYQIFVDSKSEKSERGLITGYYEPLLNGSRKPDNRYRYPLHARPADLLTVELDSLYPELAGKRVRGRLVGDKVVPYFSRAEIDRGAVFKAAPLFYVDDAMDAFFLHIQGSGRLQLPDKSIVRVGYADQNGHPYRAIGNVLVQRGEITKEAMSMQSIKTWGRTHPEVLPTLLDENPSYVFFREVSAPTDGSLDAQIDGPIGALGVPLLAQRTMAVDRSQLPLGAPLFLDAIHPNTQKPLQRLTLAQDTGGAIRGALRADFFCGTGKAAGEMAGKMREEGRLWLLWPKGATLPKRS